MRARAPASCANIGPGYDTLALALALYVEVDVEDAAALDVSTEGHGSDLPADASHLAVRVAAAVRGHDRLRVRVRSEIPVGRGLGPSAALASAAAAAAGAADPFAVAAAADGHADNAAAARHGGLVAAAVVDGVPVARRLPLDPGLVFVVLVPERTLSTREARSVLPREVPHEDAAFNLGRLAVLLAGLADRHHLVPAATEDRLHQPQRTRLFPEAPALMAGLLEAGALATCWSGAGPSLLALCDGGSAAAVRDAGGRLLAEHGVGGSALALEADHAGLTLLGDSVGGWPPTRGTA